MLRPPHCCGERMLHEPMRDEVYCAKCGKRVSGQDMYRAARDRVDDGKVTS